MSIDIDELADAALARWSASDDAIGLPLAIVLAIQAKGIRFEPDVRRLKKLANDRIAARKEAARKLAQHDPETIRAANGFSSWVQAQVRSVRQFDPNRTTGYTGRPNYQKLTRSVYQYVESVFGHLPRSARPDVFEVEAALRSLNAQKAARTRRKKQQAAAEKAKRAARKARAQAQADMQLKLF